MNGTLSGLIENDKLKFIFVGGKGGVGKTTVSSSISCSLAEKRGKTLLVSTDPAHNLSDAFDQQFSGEPQKVKGVENLYAMEVDPKSFIEQTSQQLFEGQQIIGEKGKMGAIQEIISSFPGIDEVIVFMNLIKMSKEMQAEIVVFDTAPTGHTLKLLSFPQTIEKALHEVSGIKDKIEGVFKMFGGDQGGNVSQIFDKIYSLRQQTEHLKTILNNPQETTFVAVCIPEFLSVYETERLIQELITQEIDIQNIIVNQVVVLSDKNECTMCESRRKMQNKYMGQIRELYGGDFNIVYMCQEGDEIRGVTAIKQYSSKLLRNDNI